MRGSSAEAEREGERFWKQRKRLIKLLRVEIMEEAVARKIV